MSRFSRLIYRSRQFWNALRAHPAPVSDDRLRPYLSAGEIALFRQMHASEQAHACQVLESLVSSGHTDPHLLTAALLHDVGKVVAPLSLAGRVLVVLGMHFFPRTARRWGNDHARGAWHPFVTAAQHPAWGAELAAGVGSSQRACELIRHHQDPHPGNDPLLALLQRLDGKN